MNVFEDLIFVCDDKGHHDRFEVARFANEDLNFGKGDWSDYIFISERERVPGHKLEPKHASFDDQKRLVLKCKCGRETRLKRDTLDKLVRASISNGQFKINISLLPF